MGLGAMIRRGFGVTEEKAVEAKPKRARAPADEGVPSWAELRPSLPKPGAPRARKGEQSAICVHCANALKLVEYVYKGSGRSPDEPWDGRYIAHRCLASPKPQRDHPVEGMRQYLHHYKGWNGEDKTDWRTIDPNYPGEYYYCESVNTDGKCKKFCTGTPHKVVVQRGYYEHWYWSPD
ncbi:MAG TPA: hypothetical protein VM238_18520 [Phycisphaerae bacterium]|nr:hypothetical protein [Phycisphaerae bacterium]